MTNYEILKEYEVHNTPVPSYEEWHEACDWELYAYNEIKGIKAENQKLKELLKKCVEVLNDAQRNYGYDDSIIDICSPIITKIDEVLDVAED